MGPRRRWPRHRLSNQPAENRNPSRDCPRGCVRSRRPFPRRAPREDTPIEVGRKNLGALSVQSQRHPQTGPAKVSAPGKIR
jgi:hypothetical protein